MLRRTVRDVFQASFTPTRIPELGQSSQSSKQLIGKAIAYRDASDASDGARGRYIQLVSPDELLLLLLGIVG
ncbi:MULTISPECIES: hypothetical protein [unclassified Burkholderia]|uniref:hypothetical protein n=1 Tax=unclassified Burkholderia TaxID=2613784 RepID=UPI000F587DDD|nr:MULTISPECIES: hypothetical protein [unclassified Burkholderia]RQS24813.1 hypothetical protein DIE05_25965 [Burkholderia sp. Bp8995]RQS43200.1 hypothetical protein DIE00_24430 [Burkholderia sp. Bp8989]